MELVDHQVVDAGGLEGDAGVAVDVEQATLLLLRGGELLLDLFDGQSVQFGVGEGLLEQGDLPVDVAALGGWFDGETFERLLGEDDGVPFVGGGAGDEQAPLVAGECVSARG